MMTIRACASAALLASCVISEGGLSACYTHNDMQPVRYGAEPATTRNFCRSCTAANPRDWTVASGNACCTGGEPNKDAFEKGYRPSAAAGNVAYTTDNGQYSVLNASWIARIHDVEDRDNWTQTNRSTCNANQNGKGPFRLTAYLNGLADQEDWYVFRHKDLALDGRHQSEPRVRVVAQQRTFVGLSMYLPVYVLRLRPTPCRASSPTPCTGGMTATRLPGIVRAMTAATPLRRTS